MRVLIAGGGIGGLAAALACSISGNDVQLFERSPEFAEVGAGIQLGPNAVKLLHHWGLADALKSVAAFPDCLGVRSAVTGGTLGRLSLGKSAVQRYGYIRNRSPCRSAWLAAGGVKTLPANNPHPQRWR